MVSNCKSFSWQNEYDSDRFWNSFLEASGKTAKYLMRYSKHILYTQKAWKFRISTPDSVPGLMPVDSRFGQNNFRPKEFSPKNFRPKIFGQKIFGQKFSAKKFSTKNFRPKNIRPKIFGQNFYTSIFIQIFSDPQLLSEYWLYILERIRVRVRVKFFWPKILLAENWGDR